MNISREEAEKLLALAQKYDKPQSIHIKLGFEPNYSTVEIHDDFKLVSRFSGIFFAFSLSEAVETTIKHYQETQT